MNPRHNEIAPSNTSSANSTRLPSPPSNGGGGSGVRGRPRRRSLPPLLPYPQIPLTRPPMWFPPYHPFSFGSQPPMSPAQSWRLPYYPPGPMAPLPFTRPTTAVGHRGGVQPRNAHRRRRRRNSYNSSGSSSLVRPQSADRMIFQYGISSPTTTSYPEPIEISIGVMPNERPGENEPQGEADGVMNVLLTDYMDPDNIFYVYSADDLEIIFGVGDSENVKDSSSEMNSDLNGHESPNLPPSPGNHHGVTKSVDGNEDALSDPKHGKRILPDRESSGQSNAKKVRGVQELEDKNKQLRIGANGSQEQLSCRNAWNEQLTVEDLRLELASGEVILDSSGYDMLNRETLDANMSQTFNPSQLDQQSQTNLDSNEHIL